jgi:hypothetical protein
LLQLICLSGLVTHSRSSRSCFTVSTCLIMTISSLLRRKSQRDERCNHLQSPTSRRHTQYDTNHGIHHPGSSNRNQRTPPQCRQRETNTGRLDKNLLPSKRTAVHLLFSPPEHTYETKDFLFYLFLVVCISSLLDWRLHRRLRCNITESLIQDRTKSNTFFSFCHYHRTSFWRQQ